MGFIYTAGPSRLIFGHFWGKNQGVILVAEYIVTKEEDEQCIATMKMFQANSKLISLSSADFHYPHTFTSYTSVDISFSINSAHDKMDEQEGYEEYEDYNEVPRPFNFDSDEPLVIAANEAEVEEEDISDNEDYFSNEFTTTVSVESSVNVISNIPEEEDYDSETKKSGLITKEDFIKDAAIANVANIMDVMVSSNDIQMSVATDLPNTELKLLPEEVDADTELHHEVLFFL